MISNNQNSHDDILEILEGYAAATPNGNDRNILEKWCEEHPAYAEDLIEFAANREMLAYPNRPEFESEERKREYIRRSLDTYHRFMDTRLSDRVTNLRSIIKRAAELELKKKDLIYRLGISPSILDSLESRSIEFASIPKQFLSRISEILQVKYEEVSVYLQQPILAAEFHKNHTRPENVRAVSFSDAISKDLMLSDGQKSELLSMK